MSRSRTSPATLFALVWALVFAAASSIYAIPAHAQDANIWFNVSKIERRLRDEPLPVSSSKDTRFIGDRTQLVALDYPVEDGGPMQAKWAEAPRDGSAFNNEPRFEIAAYEVQKLFLEESDYVVPPTVGRVVPLAWFRQFDPNAQLTFRGINSVVLVVQYWLMQVNDDNFYDLTRLETDSVYARHFGDFNLLTHLIRHSDINAGNFQISTVATNPRVFSVDNGVAFSSEASDRGYEWRNLRVNRLPRATVERLRKITEADLTRALAVLLQFEVRDSELVAVERSANLNPGRGVRREDSVVQFGLTRNEIRDVYRRIEDVLELVDTGRIAVF